MRTQGLKVPESFYDDFMRAYYTFQFQIVYDMDNKQQKYLNQPDEELLKSDLMQSIGKLQESGLAQMIAEGEINPDTLLSYEATLIIEDNPQEKIKSIQ